MTQSHKNQKVAVGLSGGVDSSVTAYLLKEAGYDVVGVHMVCWNEKTAGCTADQDRTDAARVAYDLGIKFEALDFVTAYTDKVINYFYAEYAKGRTPNPDVMCNKEIKFGLFLDWALTNGFDYIATGHYARIEKVADAFQLLKGIDETKDQSYFLYRLGQDQLKHVLFPLGDKTKKDIREIGKKIGLHNYAKPDSVGICFIGEVDIKEFLKRRLKLNPGNVIDKTGEVIGTHDGTSFYTIGQRHGYKLTKYMGLPTYVTGKNVDKNQLIVGFASDVTKTAFDVADISFVGKSYEGEINCDVRVRHLGELHKAKVTFSDGSTKDSNECIGASVVCTDPIFGIAPGQSAVFYIGDTLIGGGVLSS